jgi:hypothetical protein
MQARQQPLRFFYIGPSQPFQNKEVPTGMNGWQIAGSQLGTLGGAGLNYYMKQKEMAQLQDMMANNQAMANIYSGGVYPGAGGAGFYSDTTGAYPMSVPVSGAL